MKKWKKYWHLQEFWNEVIQPAQRANNPWSATELCWGFWLGVPESASPLPQPPNALRQRCVWLLRGLVVDLQYHAWSWDACEHPNGTSNYCPKETETCSQTWRIKRSKGWCRWPPASQLSPMISYRDCQVRIIRPFGCPLPTCAPSCDAANAWPLGTAAFLREVRKKRTMTYGPIWSQKWWEMVTDTYLQKSHGPVSGEKWSQHLSECRYQSTDLLTRSIDPSHGGYRRSIRIHLQTITVDRWWWIKR